MALVLAPEPPLSDWLTALDAQIDRSPTFFDGRPVVVDLGAVPSEQKGVAEFLQLLEQRGIRIIGTEGAHPSWPGIEQWGRPLAASNKPSRPIEVPPEPVAALPMAATPASEPPTGNGSPGNGSPGNGSPGNGSPGNSTSGNIPPGDPASTEAAADPAGLVVDHPIRSGQSVVFEKGDVTILGSVASGAEVMAGGSIHIYGALRGRAIAGVAGNAKARIFCSRLQAELIAIDGVYQTADDMPAGMLGKAVQVWLDGDDVKITALE